MDKVLILKQIKNHYSFSKDKDFADFLGIKQNTLATWYKRNMMDYEIIVAKCNNINANWLLTGEGQMILNQETDIKYSNELKPTKSGIPMIPFEAFGGFGDTTAEGVNIETIEERYVVPLFHGIKIDFMIPVRGSSMYPKYNSGDVVACRIIDEMIFIQWNKVYVIDTLSQGTIIKRLKRSEITDNILCRSDNKDYDDFELPKSDIRKLAMVVGVIRIE